MSDGSRFRLDVEYDGTDFSGWQRQLGVRTVQGTLEAALGAVVRAEVVIEGAGRTDAGVHALRQTAHCRLDWDYGPERLGAALEGYLPADLGVRAVRQAPNGFHARFDATGKRYVYFVHEGEQRPVLGRRWLAHIPQHLRLDAMRTAAAELVGHHDFVGFAASRCSAKTTDRTIRSVHMHRRGHRIMIWFEGSGFLYKQVRNMVGTLLEIGRGRMPAGRIREVLDSGDRTMAGPTAPSRGLVLWRVLYGKRESR